MIIFLPAVPTGRGETLAKFFLGPFLGMGAGYAPGMPGGLASALCGAAGAENIWKTHMFFDPEKLRSTGTAKYTIIIPHPAE